MAGPLRHPRPALPAPGASAPTTPATTPAKPATIRAAFASALALAALAAGPAAAPARAADTPPRAAEPPAPAAESRAPVDEPPADALLTLEGQAALRDRLWGRVATLGARARAGDLEDAALVPWQHGQAVRVDRGQGARVFTAAQLVDGASEARVSRGGAEAAAKGAASDPRTLLAEVACGGPCDALPALAPAPGESLLPGRLLHFVLPSTPEVPVLGQAASLGPQPEPFEALVAVTGRMPPGTVLFDGAGRPAALVVRNHPARTDRMLAAPLQAPADPAPAGDDAGKDPPRDDWKDAWQDPARIPGGRP